jgi:hypothetical protein
MNKFDFRNLATVIGQSLTFAVERRNSIVVVYALVLILAHI